MSLRLIAVWLSRIGDIITRTEHYGSFSSFWFPNISTPPGNPESRPTNKQSPRGNASPTPTDAASALTYAASPSGYGAFPTVFAAYPAGHPASASTDSESRPTDAKSPTTDRQSPSGNSQFPTPYAFTLIPDPYPLNPDEPIKQIEQLTCRPDRVTNICPLNYFSTCNNSIAMQFLSGSRRFCAILNRAESLPSEQTPFEQ